MEYLKSFKLFESIKHVFGNRVEYRNNEGQFHREDGPAIEYDNGNREWFFKGERHRINGPAVEYVSGYKEWWLNYNLHREDGPAVEYVNGTKYWCLNNNLISASQFIECLTNQPPNQDLFKDLPMEDLEELAADLCDKYDGEIKKWENFYAIYFKEKLDSNDPDLKSFKNRIKDFRIRAGLKSILVY